MSEARDLNDSPAPDPGRSEMEALLRSLTPRPLAIDRDALFFQAGQAAAQGSRGGRLMHVFWPAIAATLLFACGGLSLALVRTSTALETALAAATPQATDAIVTDTAPAQPWVEAAGQGVASANRFDGLASRRIDQAFSLDDRPGGQLTAHGWIEVPAGAPERDARSSPERAPKPPARPIRRPNYQELLRWENG